MKLINFSVDMKLAIRFTQCRWFTRPICANTYYKSKKKEKELAYRIR